MDDLAGKLRQPDRSVAHHVQGRFEIEGDPLGNEPAYLPGLVVNEPFTWSPELRDLHEDRADDAGMSRQQMTTKAVVCSVGKYASLIRHLELGGDVVDARSPSVSSSRRPSGGTWRSSGRRVAS